IPSFVAWQQIRCQSTVEHFPVLIAGPPKIGLFTTLTPVAFSQLHDFIFVPLKLSWSEAQAFCREHYTDLATVSDKEDNDNLLKVMANATSWIGLYRTSSASPLIWSDQSGSTFSDWAAGQPNNYAGIQWEEETDRETGGEIRSRSERSGSEERDFSEDGADPEGEGDVRRSSTFMENPIRWECLPDEGPEE
ncbi:putative C-type lectin domain family 20 member A, partial [Pimephales promelas]|uniref:putative C-type lectin domain family 20 member A n=1 Tax=Pimephales promelas TaxID=90988 RepID=UPI001955DE48